MKWAAKQVERTLVYRGAEIRQRAVLSDLSGERVLQDPQFPPRRACPLTTAQASREGPWALQINLRQSAALQVRHPQVTRRTVPARVSFRFTDKLSEIF